MLITPTNKEFATVQRLREMLETLPCNAQHEVTLFYALFTSILCWSMQRLRDRGKHTTAICEQLKTEPIDSAPWLLPVDSRQRPQARGVGPFEEFKDWSAYQLLKALRDAVAHGDDRRITPYNRCMALIGYEYTCIERDQDRRETFRANIVLLREDIRRIGCALADRHLAALDAGAGYSLRSEASNIKEA